MKSSEVLAIIFIALFGTGLIFWNGAAVGSRAAEIRIHAEAIKAHVAHYDAVTGEFTWGAPPENVFVPPLPELPRQ